MSASGLSSRRVKASNRSRSQRQQDIDVSHFSVERVLGEGGFGKVNAVIKCHGTSKGSWYAMKALSKRLILSKSTNAVQEVFSELNFLRNLNYAFLCNGHFAFQDDHFLYMVMDLALGGDLRYVLSSSRPSVPCAATS
jgi:serine/threonine kinase 32